MSKDVKEESRIVYTPWGYGELLTKTCDKASIKFT